MAMAVSFLQGLPAQPSVQAAIQRFGLQIQIGNAHPHRLRRGLFHQRASQPTPKRTPATQPPSML